MTYGRAIDGEPVSPDARAAVSHGLTSSPPRGEANSTSLSAGQAISVCGDTDMPG